eukprot:2441092-Rhodomonas_salina.1
MAAAGIGQNLFDAGLVLDVGVDDVDDLGAEEGVQTLPSAPRNQMPASAFLVCTLHAGPSCVFVGVRSQRMRYAHVILDQDDEHALARSESGSGCGKVSIIMAWVLDKDVSRPSWTAPPTIRYRDVRIWYLDKIACGRPEIKYKKTHF